MANSIITPTWVVRKALLTLHQKLNFIGRINRQYSDNYVVAGAKVGNTVKLRLPNQFTVRTGSVMTVQDVTESTLDLVLSTQKGVDLSNTAVEFTLNLSQEDFTERFIEPAMSVLAANIEADALTMYKDVYNQVNNVGTAATYAKLLGVRKQLVDNLAPMDKTATMTLNTQDNVDLVDTMKGLFQPTGIIAEQMRDGALGRSAGFEFFENTLLPRHTSGTDANGYSTNGANQTGAGVIIKTGTGTFKKGDILTFAGCNRCHPESKADTGALQQFTVTADYAGGAGTVAISPSIVITGATQNCTAAPTDSGAVVKIGGNAATYGVSMGFNKNAFAFVTADLYLPKNQPFAAREVMDGVSMRIWQGADITNDLFPTRIDVLYGFKTIRAQLASRFANN